METGLRRRRGSHLDSPWRRIVCGLCFRPADTPRTSRDDAAAGAWIFRGQAVAATWTVRGLCFRRADAPRTRRGDAAAATWIFRGDRVAATPRPRRGCSVKAARPKRLAPSARLVVRGRRRRRLFAPQQRRSEREALLPQLRRRVDGKSHFAVRDVSPGALSAASHVSRRLSQRAHHTRESRADSHGARASCPARDAAVLRALGWSTYSSLSQATLARNNVFAPHSRPRRSGKRQARASASVRLARSAGLVSDDVCRVGEPPQSCRRSRLSRISLSTAAPSTSRTHRTAARAAVKDQKLARRHTRRAARGGPGAMLS